jgi:hypothetical protein
VGGATGEAAMWNMPDFGSLDDIATGVVIAVGALVVAVVLIPLLLFGIELIVVGLLVAGGILGRGLLGRPWFVQATPVGDAAGALAWKVTGWRRSSRLIDEVAASLSDGRTPAPSEAAEPVPVPAARP